MPAGLGAPLLLASRRTGNEICHHVCHEHGREARLGVTSLAVAEGRPCGLDTGGRVSEVVREHLVLVDRLATVAPRGEILGRFQREVRG